MKRSQTSLGQRLRHLRESASLTREQLAERSGVSRRTIASLELGTVTSPRASTLAHLSQALELDPIATAELAATVRTTPSSPEATDLPRPRELPPVPQPVIGRTHVTEAAVHHLTEEGASVPRAWVLSGPPGVGKTTLAVQVAHLVSASFPDGQIFIPFNRGELATSTAPSLLRRILTSLGIHPALLPATAEGMIAMLRSKIADRRILFVLDDVPTDVDFTQWMPGAGSSAVILTARGPLAWLPFTRHDALEPLSHIDAVDLLGALIGEGRVRAERSEADRLVELCDRLPGALRMAAAWAASRPGQSVRALVDRLADERSRLDMLSGTDCGVRASLASAYAGLRDEERRALHVLGELGSSTTPAWVIAAALDLDLAVARTLLHRLDDAFLVTLDGHGTTAQVQVHTLTRLFAAECAVERERVEDRTLWHARVMAWWRGLVRSATDALPVTVNRIGALPDPIAEPDVTLSDVVAAEPSRWLKESASAMLHQVGLSSVQVTSDLCWPALVELQTWWQLSGPAAGAEAVLTHQLERCEADRDAAGHAAMLVMTALFAIGLEQPDEALIRLERAREYYVEVADLSGQLCTALEIAGQLSRRAYYEHDVDMQRQALDAARSGRALAIRLQDRDRLVDAEIARATCAMDVGRFGEVREAIEHAKELLNGSGKVQAMAHLDALFAMLLNAEGDPAAARDVLKRAETVLGDCGDIWRLARVQLEMGKTLVRLNNRERAAVEFRASARNARVLGHDRLQREAEDGLAALGLAVSPRADG